MQTYPILYSFRRCPYAMRARLGLLRAGVSVELREIVLREKPQAFLDTSPSATVPTLRDGDLVVDESLDIMIWALRQRDPQSLLDMPEEGWALISRNDGPFKSALDRTKYVTRYPDCDPLTERQKASDFLAILNGKLAQHDWLLGDRETLVDLAILPFVRQFAHIDRAWFDAQPWPYLIRWLDEFLASESFKQVMPKFPQWTEGATPIIFGT